MNANILSQRTCISMVVNGRSKWRLNRRRSTSCLDEKIEWCQETTGNKIGVCTIVRYREVCYPNNSFHSGARVEVTINTLRATVPGTIEPHSACDLCRSVRQENEYYPKMKVNRSIPVLKTLQVRSLTVTAT